MARWPGHSRSLSVRKNKPMVETKQAKSRELRPVSRSPEVQHAHQGVAYDGTYWYVIHTTWIKKYDSDWRLVAENNNVNLECGNGHLGDGVSLMANYMWLLTIMFLPLNMAGRISPSGGPQTCLMSQDTIFQPWVLKAPAVMSIRSVGQYM